MDGNRDGEAGMDRESEELREVHEEEDGVDWFAVNQEIDERKERKAETGDYFK